VLEAAGFKRAAADTLEFPADAPPAALAAARLAASRLQQLLDGRGYTGAAEACDDTGESSSSRHSSTPGFRYQTNIVECGACAAPINDGSDRLRTRSHEAPKGEYRYECTACPEGPEGFSLCERCWDVHSAALGNTGQSGGVASGRPPLHPREHAFRTIHPRMSQHGLIDAAGADNPWGAFRGASVGRARERLRERSGL
jgi:hypothetical protein